MESNTERREREKLEKDNLINTIGKVIRIKREEKNISKYALSKAVFGNGTKTSRISKIEDGSHVVDVFTLQKILLVFEVDLQEFLINL